MKMKTVGIAIDKWKLPVFTRILNREGIGFKKHPGLTADTLLIKVKTFDVDALQRVVEEAQMECSKND